RLWADALANNPGLGDDRRALHRYNAACAAALAGTGRGKEEPSPDGAARAKLRGQALGWLEAELATWRKRLGSGKAEDHERVARTLAHWKEDPDLAGLRGEKALVKLPEAERPALRRLWADIDGLLTKVTGSSSFVAPNPRGGGN